MDFPSLKDRTINTIGSNRMPSARQGISMMLVVVSLVVVALSGGAVYLWYRNTQTVEEFNPIVTEVVRSEFVAQVLCEGEIQSSENVEIKCEARARNGAVSLLRVVP